MPDAQKSRPHRPWSLLGTSPERRLRFSFGLLAGILIYGVAGYLVLEGWNLGDSVYMTIITIATVGYGEIHPLSAIGRVHTSLLIVGGMGTMLYTLTIGLEYVIAGHFGRRWEERRVERAVAKLQNHVVLCGYGRVGKEVATELQREGVPIVVVDTNQPSLEIARNDGHLIVSGDATRDEVLRQARITEARGLVAAIDSDYANVYVTLSAKGLNPNLYVVARAASDEAEPKLRRAGADRVISPYVMGGRRMAMLAVRPLAVDFVDMVMHGSDVDLVIEQLAVQEGSRLDGSTIAGARSMLGPDTMVLALEKESRLKVNPDADTVIGCGDTLVIVGNRQVLQHNMQVFAEQ